MKKINLLLIIAVSLVMTSCGSKTFLVTSGSENLISLTQITEGKYICNNPGGSVDSSWLFYVQHTDENADIYKKENPTSPAKVQVTSGTASIFPTYCKATDRIAFCRLVNGYYDIYMMPATKGNALIPVTETNRTDEYAPSISPDGNLLAYQKGDLNSIDAEIWLKNLQTGENMLLGNGATPSISPDGKKIAYAKIENNKSRNIWVMEIDGSNARQLTISKEEFAGFPKWSPDGNKIVFQANKKKSSKKNYFKSGGLLGSISQSNKGQDNFDIFVMNADGSSLMQLTTNESDDLTPFWSADNYIYFASDRGAKSGNYNIWRFKYND